MAGNEDTTPLEAIFRLCSNSQGRCVHTGCQRITQSTGKEHYPLSANPTK